MHTPSIYQQKIYEWVKTGSGNAIIQAVAGSGKTYTIVESCGLIPVDKKSIFIAFNKSIVENLRSKKNIPSHVAIKTLHSFGLSLFQYNSCKTELDKNKIDKIIDDVLIENDIEPDGTTAFEYKTLNEFFTKIITQIKSKLVDYLSFEDVNDLARDEHLLDDDVSADMMSMLKQIMNRSRNELGTIDFDDMIYLPIVLNFKSPKFDWVFVDECQDLNKSQFELIKKMSGETTRMIFVGDRRQSIYAFRGADTSSMDNLKSFFNASEFPLSICYRCPKSHIKLAKEIVPELEESPTAEDGICEVIDDELEIIEKAQDGDFILCRINAPLVPLVFKLALQGKKATIQGRDIGRGIIKNIERYRTTNLLDLQNKLRNYVRLQEEKLQLIKDGKYDRKKKESIIYNIESCDLILMFAEEVESIFDLKMKINSVFSDNLKDGIICSTVHKVKGNETNRVFIYDYNLMPHPRANTFIEQQQEENIRYVALTRAKKELYIFFGKGKK